MWTHRQKVLDRYTEIGVVGLKMRRATKRAILPLSVGIMIEYMFLAFSGAPGAAAFGLIGGSTCVALSIWTSRAIGLPLLPMIAIQSLFIYGIPIVAFHENISSYPADFVLSAGIEVLIFNLAMALSWWIAIQVGHRSGPVSHGLQGFDKSGAIATCRLGFGMLIGATLFEILQSLSLLSIAYENMPPGVDSVINVLISVANACGLFLISMVIGGDEASPMQRLLFWILLATNIIISASSFLLAEAAANLVTVGIGLFWGRGRIPWRYLTTALLSLAVLNIGKTTMRSRYWGNEDKVAVPIALTDLPRIFTEWGEASYDAIVENNAATDRARGNLSTQTTKNQTLVDRIDNMQNLLFVIDAIRVGHIKPLQGSTYALIPPLLIPRVLWPNKPRSHEGQILLNVHFGRQNLESTFSTYIAWGLLPEAYGNFGPILGSLALGMFLGVFFAITENYTARKLLISTEGFLSLCLLLSLMNSFEMVASVFVTSTFQSMVIIVAASAPFVRATSSRRAESVDD